MSKGHTKIKACNDHFDDPMHGKKKSLTIYYQTPWNEFVTAYCKENDTITLYLKSE